MARYKIYVPATSANLGPGFDVVGTALDWFNETHVEEADEFSLEIEGEGSGELPRNESHLLYEAAQFYFRKKEMPPKQFRATQINRIPMSSGLGSSSATIVSGLIAAALLSDRTLEKTELLALAVEMEGHPDNVSPAIYGGATVSYFADGSAKVWEFAPHKDLMALVLHPHIELSTFESRAVLSPTVARGEAVFNLSRLPLLIEGLRTADEALLQSGVEDLIHQPQRVELVPYLNEALDALKAQGIAGALSGAGPSIIAIFNKKRQEEIKDSFLPVLQIKGLRFDSHFISFTEKGAYWDIGK